MEEDDNWAMRFVGTNDALLLWIGIGLAVVFIGLLVFDWMRHRRQRRHYERKPEGLRARLFRPFRNIRIALVELQGMLEKHSARDDAYKRRSSRRIPPE